MSIKMGYFALYFLNRGRAGTVRLTEFLFVSLFLSASSLWPFEHFEATRYEWMNEYGGYLNVVIFNFLHSLQTTWWTREFVTQERHTRLLRRIPKS